MNDGATPHIQCKHCGAVFAPDVTCRGAWACSQCGKKNPNLKRHYRSVADLCILGLIATGIAILIGLRTGGLTFGLVLTIAHAVLLLTAIIFVYKSRTPWTDGAAKALIWTVFGLALLFNVVLPLIVAGRLNIVFLVLYALVFPYLFWLHVQAGKCTAEGSQ